MRDQRFTFLCTYEERLLLTELAERLKRTRSDTLRWLIYAAVHELQNCTGSSTDAQHNDVDNDGEDDD